MNRTPLRRFLLSGFAITGFYLAIIVMTPQAPHGRMLYDGLVPAPPYRWVHPPASRQGNNEPPPPYTSFLPLGPTGSLPAEFDTDDLQAAVTFPNGVVEPRAGEIRVRVTLTPLDPAALAPPPPGRRFDSNACRVDATYDASGAPVKFRGPITVVLRYAVHATTILRLQRTQDNVTWERLRTTVFTGSQEDLAQSDSLGTFVASSP